MGIELNLITGHAGVPHVRSKDDGMLNAIILGRGNYVANVGSRFSASVISSTEIEIGTGVLFQNGRMVSLEAARTLKIEGGTPGAKRNDLIVCRYTYDADTKLESCSIEVIRGSDSANPVDPRFNDDSILNDPLVADFPLYRLRIDGTTVGNPEKLFEDLAGGSIKYGTQLPSTGNEGDIFFLIKE